MFAVQVIRGMALGQIHGISILAEEAKMACFLASLMGASGFIRVYVFERAFASTLAVATSQFMIVFTSIIIGQQAMANGRVFLCVVYISFNVVVCVLLRGPTPTLLGTDPQAQPCHCGCDVWHVSTWRRAFAGCERLGL